MKLSIITINLNNRLGLEKTVKSVVSQSFEDFEYLIIDGGSTDGSQDVIKKYEKDINYWISEKDCGIYNAMNKGLAIAKGEYSIFMNSGDVLYSNSTLEKVFNQCNNKDFMFGAISTNNKNMKFIDQPPVELSYSYLLRHGINHQAIFTKKTLFDKFGFYDEKLKFAADWKFLILALCRYNASYQVINTIIAQYDPFGISSSNNEIVLKEKRQVINESFPLFASDYERYFKLNKFTFKGLINIIHYQIVRKF